MHYKQTMGRAASFLTKSFLYVSGLAGVVAFMTASSFGIAVVVEGDPKDDQDIAWIVTALLTLIVGMAVYAFWLVPKVRDASFFTSWIRYQAPVSASPSSQAAVSRTERRRAILRVVGAAAVPFLALAAGVIWEISTMETRFNGYGIYAAIAASCLLCGLYFRVYLRAVSAGKIAIPERVPERKDDPFYDVPEEGQTHTLRMIPLAERKHVPPVRANHRQPDGSIDYSFASEDCNEWFQ